MCIGWIHSAFISLDQLKTWSFSRQGPNLETFAQIFQWWPSNSTLQPSAELAQIYLSRDSLHLKHWQAWIPTKSSLSCPVETFTSFRRKRNCVVKTDKKKGFQKAVCFVCLWLLQWYLSRISALTRWERLSPALDSSTFSVLDREEWLSRC